MKSQFSLRGHKAPISSITRLGADIITSDRDGYVVIWKLATRRPHALWKAHDGQILTLIETPYGLLTHGRDHSIRLWKTDEGSLSACAQDTSYLGGSQKLVPPPHVEIPVNALNFSNVAFIGDYLATPASVDSENLDVYRVKDPFGAFSFTRVLENVAISSVQEQSECEEVNDSTGRGGHGIIMRLKFVSERLLYVGYESGAIFGLCIENDNFDRIHSSDRLIMFKPSRITKVFSANHHKPSPVLTLEYDAATRQLLTGSASKKLHIYREPEQNEIDPGKNDNHAESTSDLNIKMSKCLKDSDFHPEVSPHTHNLRHYGIQCIQILPESYIVGFWDGVVRGYSKTFEEQFSLERAEEAIKPAYVGTQAPEKKSLCIYSSIGAEGQITSRRDVLLSKRFGSGPFLFVGYGDGLITAFK